MSKPREFWVIPRKSEDAPYDSYFTEEVFGENKEFNCLTAFDYDPGLQEAYEFIHVIEATPAALVADELVEALDSVNWLALGYAQGLVQRRHDIDDDMKSACEKNGESIRAILALLDKAKAGRS